MIVWIIFLDTSMEKIATTKLWKKFTDIQTINKNQIPVGQWNIGRKHFGDKKSNPLSMNGHHIISPSKLSSKVDDL